MRNPTPGQAAEARASVRRQSACRCSHLAEDLWHDRCQGIASAHEAESREDDNRARDALGGECGI